MVETLHDSALYRFTINVDTERTKKLFEGRLKTKVQLSENTSLNTTYTMTAA